ncbi:hypothetical protein [Malacoplasma muris]|uniref:hypothetical protein n=1 Tax=Malacoplasma muris TaxID=2119 RepID=UPI00398F78E7
MNSYKEENYYLLLNYLILLYATKFDYLKTNTLFLKYLDYLNQKIMNCIFIFDDKDKKIFSYVNESAIRSCTELIALNKENILFIYEHDWIWDIKTIEIPYVYFYKGNILLLNNKPIYINESANANLFVDHILNNKWTSIILFERKNQIFNTLYLNKKNYLNIIGISNLPIGFYHSNKLNDLYDYISDNGLLITYVANFDFKVKRKLDKLVLGLFAKVLVFYFNGSINEFCQTIDIVYKNNNYPFIYRNSFDQVDSQLWIDLKANYVNSTQEVDNVNELVSFLKNTI